VIKYVGKRLAYLVLVAPVQIKRNGFPRMHCTTCIRVKNVYIWYIY